MQFTEKHLESWANRKGLSVDQSQMIHSPLEWQKRGLQQTATGYGRKLTSQWKVNFEGKLYRVYITCFSNCATHWILTKKHGMIFIR